MRQENFLYPGSARAPDHREPTQRGLASAVHFEVALALAGAAPMTESGKIDNRTRREFTLIGMHDRASADQQIRQICVHGARRLLGLSAVQIGGYARQVTLSGRHGARRDDRFSPEELIHDLGSGSDHWPKLFAVDHLSRPGTGVPRQPILVPGGTSWTAQAMPMGANRTPTVVPGVVAPAACCAISMIPEHFPRCTRVSLRDHGDGVRRSDVEAERTRLPAAILGDLVGFPRRQPAEAAQ